MVKVFEGTPKEFYLDGYIKSNLDKAREVIRDDWDMVGCFDGTEGGGKSVMAQQCAAYCDQDFNISRIAFTPKQFKEAVLSAKKYQAVIYDEAYGGLGSRGTMTHVNMTIVKMLTEIRQRNLFVFIVLPTFFDLDKYVALWRSRFLIHIYPDTDFKRGFFSFYNSEQKKILYLLGKKLYDYGKPRPAFTGRFLNHYTVNEQEYRKKKAESSLKEEDDARLLILRSAREMRQSIATNLEKSDLKLTKQQTSGILGITKMTLFRYLRKADQSISEDEIAKEIE